MGLSHTVSEINGDFSRKSQKNSHPLRVFCDRVPVELGKIGIGAQNQKN